MSLRQESHTPFFSICLISIMGTVSSFAQQPLPDPAPVFQSHGSARQNPKFQVDTFSYQQYGDRKGGLYEQPAYIVGNKAVTLRKVNGINRPDQDHFVTIHIDNKQVGGFTWWGSFKGGGFGYPFKEIKGDPASLKIDKTTETVVMPPVCQGRHYVEADKK